MTSISRFNGSTCEILLPGEARVEEVDNEMQTTLLRMRSRNWELLVENRKTKRRDLVQRIRDGVKRIQTVAPEAVAALKKNATPVVKSCASLLILKKEVALPSAVAAAAKASDAQNRKEPEDDLVKTNIEKVRPQAAPIASATAAAASSFEARRAKLLQEIDSHIGLARKLVLTEAEAVPAELTHFITMTKAATTEQVLAGIELQVTEWLKRETVSLLHNNPDINAVLQKAYEGIPEVVANLADQALRAITERHEEGLPPDYYNY